MSHNTTLLKKQPVSLDYSFTGVNAALAVEKGLAEADWYQCYVPREAMRELLVRRDGPAIRDALLWFALLLSSGYATYLLRDNWWVFLPYVVYSSLYASTSDSRRHESGHGTAFKTDKMNNALYEIASFMMMREFIFWRWSHFRHHSDTIIVGRDPEIAMPRPPNLRAILFSFFNLSVYPKCLQRVLMHLIGKMSAAESTFVPATEYTAVYRRARVCRVIYAAVIGVSIYSRGLLLLMFVDLTNLFGTWPLVIYGLTQRAGLVENVFDHRLNRRTVFMNRINLYLYWSMNYHVEHHMFLLVPYHALPKLHKIVKDDCPRPYSSLLSARREIVPVLLKQVKDPAYHVKRKLPDPKKNAIKRLLFSSAQPDSSGWIDACAVADLGMSEVIRFDQEHKKFALYRDQEHRLYATDGVCTHGNTHLADGLIVGKMIEFPKYNGRFNLIDGSPARTPICRELAIYPIEERLGRVYINIVHASGVGARAQKLYRLHVVSNRSVTTFIKKLVLDPLDISESIAFTPGDYFQFDIPAYKAIRFRDFDISEPLATL